MLNQKIHHVADRCKDAKQTVDWYEKHLDMKFVLDVAEKEVPSTHAPDPAQTRRAPKHAAWMHDGSLA